MHFLYAINGDRQTPLLNVLGQIAMALGDKKIASSEVLLNIAEKLISTGYGCRLVSDRTSCANSSIAIDTVTKVLGDAASTSLTK